MRLRSLTTHLREQNWFAVALDFLIVVVGILIAFQITIWNEERADRQRAAAYLEMLQADFAAIIERLDTNLAIIDTTINSIAYVRDVLNSKPELSNEEAEAFSVALNLIDNTRVPGSRSATFIEMQSSGELNLIDNPDLKKSLFTYDQSTEVAHIGLGILQATITDFIQPVIYQHIEFAPKAVVTPGEDQVGVQSFNYDRMRNEPDFKSVLSALSRVQSNLSALQASQRELAEDAFQRLTNETQP